jgi:hypothetical protein
MAALPAVGLACVRFAADHPLVYRPMFGPECDKSDHADLLAAGHEALGVLIAAVATCRSAGPIGQADVHQVALAVWALSHGLASPHAVGILAPVMPGDLDMMARRLMHKRVDGVRRREAASHVANGSADRGRKRPD